VQFRSATPGYFFGKICKVKKTTYICTRLEKVP
jgi:hypothetical protein